MPPTYGANFRARTCLRCGKEKRAGRFCRNCMRIDRERDGLPVPTERKGRAA